MDFIKKFSITPSNDSEVQIEGEIPFTELQKYRAKAIKDLGKNIKVDGFREGHIPDTVLVSKIGEMPILTEMAERAISAVYPEIIKANNIEAIGYPKIEITKIALENPLGFKATVAVLPKIELADYKRIATKINKTKSDITVTDEELDEQIKNILRQKAAYERLQKKAAAGETVTHTHADGTVHEGPDHDDLGRPIEDINELEIPELSDEVVKTLGQPGQFENVDDFKTKIREHFTIEKTREAESKRRANITDEIVADSKFALPQILLDSEISQMFAQMEEEIQRAGLTVEDYLSHMKKTREDMKAEWTPMAEKRARLQLVLNEIAKKENLKADEQQLEEEVKHLLEHYKNADKDRVRVYVESVLTNEAVMKFLESQ